MAFSLGFLLFSSLLLLLLLRTDALVLPVTKDQNTLQYLTQIHQGEAPDHVPIKLVLDLGGPYLWAHSGSGRTVHRTSVQCSTATAYHHTNCETNCTLTLKNTVTGRTMKGDLVEDAITPDPTQPTVFGLVRIFLFRAPRLLLFGLATGARGMAGLGRTRVALPEQLAGESNVHRKFSVCLSPSSGFVYFGVGSPKLFKSLVYTPLITSSDAPEEYFIGVKAVKINGRKIQLNGSLLSINEEGLGGTKLSTVVPYTMMETSIYEAFTEGFVEEAIGGFNMSRVAAVAPFDACFGAKSGVNGAVPMVDLVLQSEMVKWRIDGSNSMVRVSDEVVCLGFLNGGVNQRASIVIGGYQLENNLVEFDLGGSMVGFSSNRCSDFDSFSSESRWYS